MSRAPIALFVFKRPEETRQTLEHLSRNPGIEESELFVFCDAARLPRDAQAVQATREAVRSRAWCPRTTIVERSESLGLAGSIIEGVGQLVRSHGRVIVLEDDLLTARGFLAYMNEALARYEDAPSVMQIAAHMFSIPMLGSAQCSFFIPSVSSWGWATWKRAWDAFDPDCKGWEILKTDPTLRSRFDLDDSFGIYRMLEAQMAGSIDSWAVRWRWSVFQKGGLTLCPNRTLVKNIGFGKTATHTTSGGHWMETRDWDPDMLMENFPEHPSIDQRKWELFRAFFKVNSPPCVSLRILRRLGIPSTLFVRLLMQRVIAKRRGRPSSPNRESGPGAPKSDIA